MGRCSDAPHPRYRKADSRRSLRRFQLSEGSAGGYYDVHKIQNMRHELTILAYEMNGAPLSVLHGGAAAAALRERVRLQDGQVDRGDRVCARFRPPWRRPRRL
jgi:Oxidoreductase molybdopterin binding domain